PPATKGGSQITKDPAADWELVPGKDSRGTLHRVAFGYAGYGSVRAEGPGEGMFVQEVKVNQHSFYKIRVFARQLGHGNASVRIGWRDAVGHEIGGLQTFTAKQPPTDQWRQIVGTVRSPSGAVSMIVQLVASAQTSDRDAIWFDDVEAYSIEVN